MFSSTGPGRLWPPPPCVFWVGPTAVAWWWWPGRAPTGLTVGWRHRACAGAAPASNWSKHLRLPTGSAPTVVSIWSSTPPTAPASGAITGPRRSPPASLFSLSTSPPGWTATPARRVASRCAPMSPLPSPPSSRDSSRATVPSWPVGWRWSTSVSTPVAPVSGWSRTPMWPGSCRSGPGGPTSGSRPSPWWWDRR